MRDNKMETEGDKIKLDGFLSGIMCSYQIPYDTGKRDEFGRPIYKIHISHVPSSELVLDPMSVLEDYSDARYIHRYKWISKEDLMVLFPNKKSIIASLDPYNEEPTEHIRQAEFEYKFNQRFYGHNKEYDYHLLIHTVLIDNDDKTWSIYWSNRTIIDKQEISYRKVQFPYRVHKLHPSERSEYYGIFRGIKETQRAINQAVNKIQHMVNTSKVFANAKTIKDKAKFESQYSKINSILWVDGEVTNTNLLIHDDSKEVADQYEIINKGIERVQRILGINDAFIGFGYKYDSGRKSKLNQNASAVALKRLTSNVQQFYRLQAMDTANYIQQYYTSHHIMSIVDRRTGQKWLELNRPIVDENGKYVMEPVMSPEDGKPLRVEGRYIYAPIPTLQSEIRFSDFDLRIDTVVYDDQDEKNQLMLETVLQGFAGQNLSQYSPGDYLKVIGMSIEAFRTKDSMDIAKIFKDLGDAVKQAGAPPVESTLDNRTSAQPESQQLRLQKQGEGNV